MSSLAVIVGFYLGVSIQSELWWLHFWL